MTVHQWSLRSRAKGKALSENHRSVIDHTYPGRLCCEESSCTMFDATLHLFTWLNETCLLAQPDVICFVLANLLAENLLPHQEHTHCS